MPEEITLQVTKFLNTYKKVSNPKGQLLILPGDTTDKVFYLEMGRISVYDVSYRGDEKTTNQ